MPQFALLLHECPSGLPRAIHWDLMLQVGGVLRTWVLHELPAAWRVSIDDADPFGGERDGSIASAAEEIQPHRLDYLTFEGPLSGDRGSVVRVDRGPYEPMEISDCRIRARLLGERIRGVLELARSDVDKPAWRISFSQAKTAD